MGKHIDIFQIGAHIGNSINDPIYCTDLNNKSVFLIEPVPFLFDILMHNYKVKSIKENIDVKFLNVAVSDMDGLIEMYAPSKKCDFSNLPFWISQLGSTTDEHIHTHNLLERFPEFKIEKIQVNCLTLNTIIKANNITSIDTLIVDTEGHDYKILKALDLSILKPKNIIFEHKYMDGTYKRGENFIELTNHFYNNGYKFIKEDDDDIYLSLDNSN